MFAIFTWHKPEIGTKLEKCMRQNVRELALDGLIQVEKSGGIQ
ncbi:hypothetical protein ACT7DH_28440 [Bacillus pacificus]